MKAAGWACAVGVPGWRLIETTDPAERLTLLAVAKHAQDARMHLNGHALLMGGGTDGQ